MQIISDFIPKGRRNRPGHAMTPKYITVHDTANAAAGADAAMHAKYLKNTPNLLAGWHFTVCSKAIYQHLPLNENGWHAGDGVNGTGNRQSIGIEICENKDGNRAQAEKNAAWLVAKLLREQGANNPGIPIENVVQHNHWTGKNCPRVLRGRKNGWADFLNAVQAHLAPPVTTPIIGLSQVTAVQAQAWARSKSAHQRFIDIAPVYWYYGTITGIRPEVLYAQAAKETAFGRYGGAVTPDQNNWAGVKTKNASGDRREDHESFPTPDDGVRAHFNHMAAYVGINPIGEPHERYLIVKSMPWAGTIRTVEELSGKWAPAQDYGQSICDYLIDLLTTSVTTPAAGEVEQLKAQIDSLRRERDKLSAELGIANGKIQDAIKVLNR